VSGESTTGTIAWTFRIDVPAGIPGALLPPSSTHPWRLQVDDGGYLNRSGRITGYRLIWHAPGGDITYEGGPVPQPTLESQSVFLAAPQTSASADGAPAEGGVLRYGPNPVNAGGTVTFTLPQGVDRRLEIFDLAGRTVAHVPLRGAVAGSTVAWQARDGSGHALAPGLYLARAGARNIARIVVVRR
jgi:flagellar hook capping protein FlgD